MLARRQQHVWAPQQSSLDRDKEGCRPLELRSRHDTNDQTGRRGESSGWGENGSENGHFAWSFKDEPRKKSVYMVRRTTRKVSFRRQPYSQKLRGRNSEDGKRDMQVRPGVAVGAEGAIYSSWAPKGVSLQASIDDRGYKGAKEASWRGRVRVTERLDMTLSLGWRRHNRVLPPDSQVALSVSGSLGPAFFFFRCGE
jgi:hypothetical protein